MREPARGDMSAASRGARSTNGRGVSECSCEAGNGSCGAGRGADGEAGADDSTKRQPRLPSGPGERVVPGLRAEASLGPQAGSPGPSASAILRLAALAGRGSGERAWRSGRDGSALQPAGSGFAGDPEEVDVGEARGSQGGRPGEDRGESGTVSIARVHKLG